MEDHVAGSFVRMDGGMLELGALRREVTDPLWQDLFLPIAALDPTSGLVEKWAWRRLDWELIVAPRTTKMLRQAENLPYRLRQVAQAWRVSGP